MWQCPKCNAVQQNPEAHWRHLEQSKKCMEHMTENPTHKGWQGVELDGMPTIIYKPDENIPRELWNKPKSKEEQDEFRAIWTKKTRD